MMIKRTKLSIMLTSVLIICTLISGCMGKDGDLTDTDTKKETLYLFNSKGENAQQFKEMCDEFTNETGIPTSPFTVGAGQDAMDPLRTQMNSKNPPAVFSIQGLKELTEWEESGRALDLSTVEDKDFKALADSVPDSMKLTSDGKASYGIPFNVEGYGYMLDRDMLKDLFGENNRDKVITELKTCSYDDFIKFCDAVTEYIASPSAKEVSLNGKSFAFNAEKTGLAQKLNGVFAFAGAEKWTYGDHLINVAMNAVFPDARSAENATAKQVDELKAPFIVYAKALEYVSTHGAGLKGASKRGSDIISAANFGYDQSIQMYADGNALFLQQGNWTYANISKISKDVADRSVLIPVKLPLTNEMIKTGKTAEEMNSSIPVYAPNYYAINAKASEIAQKQAIQFLNWLYKPENVQKYIIESFASIPFNADDSMKIDNSLSLSIMEYMEEDKTLGAPYHGAPNAWSSDVVGKEVMEKYLVKEQWTEADYEAISSFAIDRWKESKNLK